MGGSGRHAQGHRQPFETYSGTLNSGAQHVILDRSILCSQKGGEYTLLSKSVPFAAWACNNLGAKLRGSIYWRKQTRT